MSDPTPDRPLTTVEKDVREYAQDSDKKGVSYIWNLIAVYAVFGLCMIVVAWFGVFSEV